MCTSDQRTEPRGLGVVPLTGPASGLPPHRCSRGIISTNGPAFQGRHVKTRCFSQREADDPLMTKDKSLNGKFKPKKEKRESVERYITKPRI